MAKDRAVYITKSEDEKVVRLYFPGNEREADMSSISKTELEAILRANKSEVDVVAAEMKTDIAEFKAFQAQQFATLNNTLVEIKGQISNTNAEVTAVKGQIEGMKTSYTSIQWMVGSILMVLALILALPHIQGYLKPSEQANASQTQSQGESGNVPKSASSVSPPDPAPQQMSVPKQ